MKEFNHFILTRFNVKIGLGGTEAVPPDLEWLIHRFDLFDKFCYPSVRGQTNHNFKWLVFFDVDTPERFKTKIENYTRWGNFIPYYLNSWSEYKQRLLENIADSDYIITTRLDNDDALGSDFIKTIQNNFSGQEFEFLNITNGCVLWKNNLYLRKHHSNAFISLVESTKNLRTVYCDDHTKVSSIGNVKQIETQPMWLQIFHKYNFRPRTVEKYWRQVLIKSLNNNFALNFFFFHYVQSALIRVSCRIVSNA